MEPLMEEMFTTESPTLIEENQNVKQLLTSTTQRLTERQLNLEENNKVVHKLQCDVEQTRLINKVESQLRYKFEEKYKKTQNIITEFIKIYNNIKNTIQLCLNDQNQYEICNKELTDQFNQYKKKSYLENEDNLALIKHNLDILEKLKIEHDINLRDFEKKIKVNDELIVGAHAEIDRLQDDNDEIDKVIESLSIEMKSNIEKQDKIFNEFTVLKETYESFVTNSKNETTQLTEKINEMKLPSKINKDSIENVTEEIEILQNAYDNQNNFIEDLKSKIEHFKLLISNFEQEKADLIIKMNNIKDTNGQESVDYNCKIVENEVKSEDFEEKYNLLNKETELVKQEMISWQLKIDELDKNMLQENQVFGDLEKNLAEENLIIAAKNNKFHEKIDELEQLLAEKVAEKSKSDQEFEILNKEYDSINAQTKLHETEYNAFLSVTNEKEIDMNLTTDATLEEEKILQCNLKQLENDLEELKRSDEEKLHRKIEEFDEKLNNLTEEQNELITQYNDEDEQLSQDLNKWKGIIKSAELQIIELKTAKKTLENELGLKIEEISKFNEMTIKKEESRKKEQKLEELRIKQNEELKKKEQKRLEIQATKKQNEALRESMKHEEELKQREELEKFNLTERDSLEKGYDSRILDAEQEVEFNFRRNDELLNKTINDEFNYKMKEYERKQKTQKEFEKQQAQQLAQKELQRQLETTGLQISDLKDSITLIPKKPNPIFKKPIPRYSSSSLDTSDSSFDGDLSFGKRRVSYKSQRQSKKKQAMAVRDEQNLDDLFNSLLEPTPTRNRR